MSSPVTSPEHYQQAKALVQPIELCRRFPFCFGNFCKYVLRAPYKGQELEDLAKALQYLHWCDDFGEWRQVKPVLKANRGLVYSFDNDWLMLLDVFGRRNLMRFLESYLSYSGDLVAMGIALNYDGGIDFENNPALVDIGVADLYDMLDYLHERHHDSAKHA